MNANAPNTWDPIWEDIYSHQAWGKYPPEHVIRFVARRWYKLNDRSVIRILDLGCGPGACTWYLAREGFSVSGIDGSRTALQQAARRLAEERLSADLKLGDFAHLPWPDEYFDGVIDNATLCCNPYSACLRVRDEVLRVLRVGAHFMSCNFTDDTWGTRDGVRAGENEYYTIKQGPLAGRGFVLAMDKKQLEQLFSPFGKTTIEQITWSSGNMKNTTKLWLVEASKL